MKPKIIKTDEEHEAALAYLESLMDAEPGSPQEDELELWSLLVEDYEKEHFPIEDPDPVEAIRFRMDQLGLQSKDLTEYMGSKSKVSEVLNRKRNLSLPMIRNLHQHLGIPAATLVRESKGAPMKPATTNKRHSKAASDRSSIRIKRSEAKKAATKRGSYA